jgi:predicted ATPase/class 3 adenylate cyclase
MMETLTLVMTDVVDSTQVSERLGDVAMNAIWALHDTIARDLIRTWRGIEIGRSDGFLVLFNSPADAVDFALAYHRALAGLDVPLKARAGVHTGPVTLRENRSEDTAHGATPFEVDGVALPITARVMSAALGRQTLTTAPTLRLLQRPGLGIESHGYWRLKGVEDPIELFEVGDEDALFIAPPDSPKAYRVVRQGEGWATLRDLPNNLPAERGVFIGRLEPLKALARVFGDGARLVTLMGIGGIGKTRLALSYARSWLGDYPGGVWFCDLNVARGVDGIVHVLNQALEIPASHGDPIEQIGAAIDGRGDCLVVLDTFEQVARHAEATIGVWLERAPNARFLVTSREVLGIGGENAVVLAPLPPDEAEQLFRQRIKAAGLPVALQPADEQAIPPLMLLLDCLPLAIELAAARARVMMPNMMLQRMDERFKVLARRGERHDRQNTLRATLDWSWDLLTPGEQAALMQLAVFEGGVALEAAEAVIGPGLPDADEWVPDLLQALIEKSLLRMAGAQRFDLLRAVQDYAGEHLAAAGAAAAAERRHWRWFAALGEAQAVASRGVEAENIVIACRRAVPAEPAAAVALLRNAWAVLRLTGPFGVGLDLGHGVRAALPDGDARQAIVDGVLGAAAMLLGDFGEARRRYAGAMETAQRSGDVRTLAQTRCQLAQLELASGDAGAAEHVLLEVQQSDVFRTDAELRYICLNGLGLASMQRSRWTAARRFFTDALTLAEARADRRWEGGLHGNLALIARVEGRRDEARHHWQTALRWADEIGDRQWAGNNHCNLGLLHFELGEQSAALNHLQTALDIARAIGHPRLEATALCNLGLVEDSRRDFPAAADHHARAAQVAQSLGDRRLEGQARGYLGLALTEMGRNETALAELRKAQDLLRPLGDPTALALALLQSAVAMAASEDSGGAQGAMEGARECFTQMTDGVDAEVAAMLERAQAAVDRMRDPMTARGADSDQ